MRSILFVLLGFLFLAACNSFSSDYGTGEEESQLSPEAVRAEEESLEASYQRLFDYLTQRDSMVLRKQKTKGLGLSQGVLAKIFAENYLQILADTK